MCSGMLNDKIEINVFKVNFKTLDSNNCSPLTCFHVNRAGNCYIRLSQPGPGEHLRNTKQQKFLFTP
jgi:hypothetical protein